MPLKNDTTYYTPREASAYLGIDSQTLKRWEKKGRIYPQYILKGKRADRRYTRKQLDYLLRTFILTPEDIRALNKPFDSDPPQLDGDPLIPKGYILND